MDSNWSYERAEKSINKMSKIICFKVEEPFKNNRLFVKGGFLDFFYDTKIKLEKIGFKVGTHDLVNEKKADYIIYCDYRKDFIDNKGVKILLAMESIAVIPKTFKKNYLDKFDYVFTWNEEIIDNIKIFPLCFSGDLKRIDFIDFNKKLNLICNVSANKFSTYKNELYTERVRAIEYFSHFHSEKFDLYGSGWTKPFKFPLWYKIYRKCSQYKIPRILFKIIIYTRVFDRLFFTNYITYKGTIESKANTIKNYKFCLCYENVKNIDGYITEKIFDCFKAGVIPIYLGPKNINKVIPADTFIDKREFASYDKLFSYISNMDKETYNEYIRRIKSYLDSDSIRKFESNYSSEYFINKLVAL